MDDRRTFLQIQIFELKRLLKSALAHIDPILVPQLRARLARFEEELATMGGDPISREQPGGGA